MLTRSRPLSPFFIIAYLFGTSGCAYRFTNLTTELPGGVKRVAVESIYDTAHVALPHEILWEEMQMELGRKGSLHVVSRNEADAILRLHIMDANVGIAPETIIGEVNAKDPNIFDRGEPEFYDEFRKLPKAGRYATSEAVSYAVNCELWDARSGALLKQFRVSGAANYAAIRSTSIVRPESNYVRAEEAQEGAFRNVARGIAAKVVSRLIIER